MSTETKTEKKSDGVDDNTGLIWQGCGRTTSRSAIVCVGQYVLMFAVLLFCSVMLAYSDGDCNKNSPYIGLISFVLGKGLANVVQ
jgi:hypothetical protein